MGLGDIYHPYHGRAYRIGNSENICVYGANAVEDLFMEVEVVKHRHEPMSWQVPLYEAIILPSSTTDHTPLYGPLVTMTCPRTKY